MSPDSTDPRAEALLGVSKSCGRTTAPGRYGEFEKPQTRRSTTLIAVGLVYATVLSFTWRVLNVRCGRQLDRRPTQPSDRFLISYPPFAPADYSRPLRLLVAKVPTAAILQRLTAPASKPTFRRNNGRRFATGRFSLFWFRHERPLSKTMTVG